MEQYNIRVADVDMGVTLTRPGPTVDLYRYFDRAQEKPAAQLNVTIDPLLEYFVPSKIDGNSMDILMHPEGALIHLMRHVGYLAGTVSERYRFYHAAGVKIDGKGVILIGRSKSYKSELSEKLEGSILDDDMMMVSATDMKRVSRVGFKSHNRSRLVEKIEDDNCEAPLNYVFVLNLDYETTHIREIDQQDIDPETALDDLLHDSLLVHYAGLEPMNFKVPIFEIGTNGNLTQARNNIESIIQCSSG